MTNLEHIFHSICGADEKGRKEEGERATRSQLFFFLLLSRVWSDTPIATRS